MPDNKKDPYTFDLLMKWINDNILDEELADALMRSMCIGTVAIDICIKHGLKKEFDQAWLKFLTEAHENGINR